MILIKLPENVNFQIVDRSRNFAYIYIAISFVNVIIKWYDFNQA